MKLNYQTTNDPDGYYEIFGGVDDTEEYRTNPITTGLYSMVAKTNQYRSGQITGTVLPAHPNNRYGWYISVNSTETHVILNCSGTQNFGLKFKRNGSTEQTSGEMPVDVYNDDYQKEMTERITTNIPIFDNATNRNAYISASTDEEALQILREHAINYIVKCYKGCM